MATINQAEDGTFFFAVRNFGTGKIVGKPRGRYVSEDEAMDAHADLEWLSATAPFYGEFPENVVYFAEIEE